MTFTLVVAKYKEDISWTQHLPPHIDLQIYDKERDYPNIGRESETYLRYILEHYECLPDHVGFVQGNPFDHIAKDHFYRILEGMFYGDAYIYLGRQENELMNCYNMYIDRMIDALFFMRVPSMVSFSIGAQFIVPRNRILCRPRIFYQTIYDVLCKKNPLFVETEKTNCLVTPWSLERIWDIIFDPSVQHKQFIECDLLLD